MWDEAPPDFTLLRTFLRPLIVNFQEDASQKGASAARTCLCLSFF